MNIEKIKMSKLNPTKYNPRKDLKPGDSEYEKLKRSMSEFGYVEPIIWNKRTGNIVGGHQRYKILKDMGYTDAECVVVDLDGAHEKALNVALNKISGEFDIPILTDLLKDLSANDFDVSLTGFDENEISYLFSDVDAKEGKDDDYDVNKALEEATFVSQGDLWQLGKHKMLCGDATNFEDLNRLMGDEKANLIVTDPPYNVNFESASGLKIKNDKQTSEKFYEFLLSAFKNVSNHLVEGASAYIFHADTEGLNFRKAFIDSGFHLSGVCIWAKNSFVMGRFPYQWGHEPILYGWLKTGKHKWYAGRAESTIWHYDKPKKNGEHPTMKPIPLLCYPIKNSSAVNSIILDTFAGSGSTLMACQQMDRICYCMELDPKYASVIIRRYVESYGDENVFLVRGNDKIPYSKVTENAKNELTLGSLFDGSGGFPLGGLMCGIKPIWASEIEPFAIRVTTKRLPFMKHLGDINAVNGSQIDPVDIITFGSPCQDVSIAGKREGLDGSRSGLFYEAIRVIKEMRRKTNGKYPRYCLWENVPGALSSNKGEDFKNVLESICQIKEDVSVPKPEKWSNAGKIVGDNFSLAWRVLDARHFGVPQRRKRIYLVADFDGDSAGEILFESEGLSGYSAASFRAWQRTAESSGDSTKEAVTVCLNDQGGQRMDITENETSTLRAESHHPPLVFENHSQDTRYKGPIDVSQTVLSTFGGGGNNQPFILETPKTLKMRAGCEGGGKGALIQNNKSATLGTNNDQVLFVPTVYALCSKNSNSMKSKNPHSGIYKADTSRTLDENVGNPVCNQGGMVVLEGGGTRPSHHGTGYKEADTMYTLNTVEMHGVAYGLDRATFNMGQNAQFGITVKEESAPTVVAKGPGAVSHPVYTTSKSSYHVRVGKNMIDTLMATDYKDPPTISETPYYIVRRLMPTECAKLQGFPSWWCKNLETENPSEDEITFWKQVFDTHSKIMGKSRSKTENQIIKWLKNPHSDTAEYTLWGNGVALPCVYFVLSGIAYFGNRR